MSVPNFSDNGQEVGITIKGANIIIPVSLGRPNSHYYQNPISIAPKIYNSVKIKHH